MDASEPAMPDDASNKRPGSKTWLDILGQRMEAAKKSAAEAESELHRKSQRVRFSDLAPPGEKNTFLGLGSEPTSPIGAAPPPHEVTAPLLKPDEAPPPAPKTPPAPPAAPAAGDDAAELRRKLQTSEEKCREAESRVADLQAEVDALRDLIAQANVGEMEQLRLRLAEAYEIIHAIEQAYLAGECPPTEPPR
jgi:hypothetical protein